MAGNQITNVERLFQALGDATRLRILGLLLTGEVCVCDIHESLKLSQPKVSRHLAYLRKAGLVDTRRDGLWVHYRLAAAPDPVLGAIRDAVTHALTHLNAVQRDAKRLEKKTGCCLPATAGTFPCCSGVTVQVAGRSTTPAAYEPYSGTQDVSAESHTRTQDPPYVPPT